MAMPDIPEQADAGGIQVSILNDGSYSRDCRILIL